jgi:hypothetical protein
MSRKPRNGAIGTSSDENKPDGINDEIRGTGGDDSSPASSAASSAAIDPAAISAASSGEPGSAKRGRGRPPGSRNSGGSGKSETLDLAASIKTSLQLIHSTLAGLSGREHWNITEQEAELVGNSGANVARHYPSVKVAQKYQDWFNFTFALGTVYGARIKVSRDIRKAERKAAAPAQPRVKPGHVVIPGVGMVPDPNAGVIQ